MAPFVRALDDSAAAVTKAAEAALVRRAAVVPLTDLAELIRARRPEHVHRAALRVQLPPDTVKAVRAQLT